MCRSPMEAPFAMTPPTAPKAAPRGVPVPRAAVPTRPAARTAAIPALGAPLRATPPANAPTRAPGAHAPRPAAPPADGKSPAQKGNGGGARPGAGRPPFVPTREQRSQVEAMAGFGLPQERICLLVINPTTGRPIDEKTLRAHFADEIAQGSIKADAAIGQSLFKKATGSGPQAVAAAIFWAKCRMGWKEKSEVSVDVRGGVLVAPAAATPEQWIAAMAAANATKERPGSAVDAE